MMRRFVTALKSFSSSQITFDSLSEGRIIW